MYIAVLFANPIPTYLPAGIPFSKILQEREPGLIAQAGKAVPHLIEAYGKMIFQDGLFHVSPTPKQFCLFCYCHSGLRQLSETNTSQSKY